MAWHYKDYQGEQSIEDRVLYDALKYRPVKDAQAFGKTQCLWSRRPSGEKNAELQRVDSLVSFGVLYSSTVAQAHLKSQ